MKKCNHCGIEIENGKHCDFFAEVSPAPAAPRWITSRLKMTLCEKCRDEIMDMLSKFQAAKVEAVKHD